MSSIDVRAIDETTLPEAPAPAARQEFRVFLSEQAFDRAVARGDSDIAREIGGVLVGEVLRDAAGPYLKVDGTVDALHAEEKGAELTFTHATWEHIHKEMDGEHKGKKIVGWYHTHPGFGIFLSDRDQFIQKSFFNLPFQVAFVYDPRSREHGVFTWRDNEVVRARRYWIGSREQLWDGPRTPPPSAADKASDKADRARTPVTAVDAGGPAVRLASRDDGLTSSLLQMAGAGVIAFLLGGLVGHWLGAGSANQVANDMQVQLGKARAEGAQQLTQLLQHDLVRIVRDAMTDDAVRRPIEQAIGELDRALAVLPPVPPPAAAPAAGGATAGTPAGSGSSPAAEGTGSSSAQAAPGPGSGGAQAAPGAASGDIAATVTAGAGASPPAKAAAPAGVKSPSADEARLQAVAVQLQLARDALVRLGQERMAAAVTLNQLERATRRSSELRSDLAADVAEHRSGLGGLYAELAGDAVKAGDPARARRLLVVAARLDPGNRTRYEHQLQSFDKAASLPREVPEPTGSAGPGAAGSAGRGVPR